MIYLVLALASYGLSYYVIGLLIDGQVADIAEGMRHRRDAPAPGQYLRAVQARLRRVRCEYSLMVGTFLTALSCVGAYWLG
ncbi:hypothetical protein G7017_21580 [Pseudomonas fulva]|uniref:hypothetical protein n=1 Tax=Pseudomonas TaxID=286 RepID=UPI000B502B25|nr:MULTISPECIES: hypothetical protein [Pseudomonas]MCP3792673.1 hypothetical protein [Pseudomonas sp. N2-11]MDP9666385.1 hypothetical protein [Pseudomonas cremoricolorata]AVF55487.1 hypothetical protein AL527_10120 [Pseudomonas fulva]MBA1223450.1 hypothetical protein [Pseudomonas fulva]MBN4168309.1 hypothetical protein [Pseudomonas fulva]